MRKKAHADDPGYRCSLKTRFGQAVVYDRNAGFGGAGRARWAVVAYDNDDNAIGTFDRRTERAARDSMKALRDGTLEPRGDGPIPQTRPSEALTGRLAAMARAAAERVGVSVGYATGWLKAEPLPDTLEDAIATFRKSPKIGRTT